MTGLPTVGADSNTWGTKLNAFLGVALNADGSLKNLVSVKDPVYGAVGDGTTDDTTAIQAAITAVQTAGGGTVYFPASTYLISSTLTISADNIQLLGAGWASQILAKSTFSGYMLTVAGPGGAGNFRYGFAVRDIFFNGGGFAAVQGFDMVSCYASLIDHLRMRNVPGINLHYDGISGAFGAYNYLRDSHITDGGATAVGLQTDNSEWLTVQGCQFGFFSGGTAIACYLKNLNNKIIGTSFDHNDIGVQMDFAGRNIVQSCQFDRGYTYFIRLRGTVGNIIAENEFATSSGGADIIRVDSSQNSNNIIKGNACTSTGWTNFVNEIAATGGTIPNNYEGNQTNGYAVIRQTGIFRNNQGYNPVGHAVAQPAVPATTVAQTNTTGVDCTVFVAGGTVTVIAIGGTATGMTSGAFRVPAGQTITLTYSVAPTWQWFGD